MNLTKVARRMLVDDINFLSYDNYRMFLWIYGKEGMYDKEIVENISDSLIKSALEFVESSIGKQ